MKRPDSDDLQVAAKLAQFGLRAAMLYELMKFIIYKHLFIIILQCIQR